VESEPLTASSQFKDFSFCPKKIIKEKIEKKETHFKQKKDRREKIGD